MQTFDMLSELLEDLDLLEILVSETIKFCKSPFYGEYSKPLCNLINARWKSHFQLSRSDETYRKGFKFIRIGFNKCKMQENYT